jgi:hypothetical protein
MSLVKDLYLDELDELVERLIEAGHSEDEANDIAAEDAFYKLQDRLADIADRDRKIGRGE